MSALRTSTNSNLRYKKIESQDDLILAFSLVQELNPSLTLEKYLVLFEEMKALGNYELLLAYEKESLVGICGYWIASKFYCGRYLEIDNFIIDAAYRSHNYGSEFVSHIEEIARAENCDCIMLDAYLENKRGHAFYERNGYKARGYHFIKEL